VKIDSKRKEERARKSMACKSDCDMKESSTNVRSLQEVPITEIHVRFEVFTAVTMKNSVFWDVMPRGFCKNRRLGGN
jgi:hypothetical protein